MISRAIRTGTAVVCLTAAFLILAPVGAQTPAPGTARVVPIQVTGDPAARFSMVVMGDGYTAAEIPKFRAQLDST